MIFERMKDIRESYDKTQMDMANVLKVSRSTYAGWENGIDLIPLLKINEFCNYFNISLDYICGLTNTQKYEISNLEIDKMLLGQNIKNTRIKNNDTQENVAKTIGVDQSNYSKYELGKILIHTYPLIEFAKYYNISIDWLCGKTKDLEIK